MFPCMPLLYFPGVPDLLPFVSHVSVHFIIVRGSFRLLLSPGARLSKVDVYYTGKVGTQLWCHGPWVNLHFTCGLGYCASMSTEFFQIETKFCHCQVVVWLQLQLAPRLDLTSIIYPVNSSRAKSHPQFGHHIPAWVVSTTVHSWCTLAHWL